MLNRTVTIILAGLATFLLFGFILGLAQSISAGFAGFWGGLPFWIIAIFVLLLALYDFWEDAIKKDQDGTRR